MNKTGTRTLETHRLTLRQFRIGDAEDMFANWASDPEVTRFLTWPTHTGVDITRMVLGDWIPRYEDGGFFNWAIEWKETGRVIGNIAVVRLDENVDAAELGYCRSRSFWGRGIMPEALRAVIDYLFDVVGANRIAACHDVNNPRSGRVMDKAGMKPEGILRGAGKNNRGICDEAWHAMIRRDREPGPELRIELQDNEWPFEYTDHERRIARAIVFDDDGFFYFVRVKRDDAFERATLIETSGGGAEEGEDLRTAVKRELKEELGAEVEIICKLGVVRDAYNLVHRQNLNNYFLCRAVSFGANRLNRDEIEDFHLSVLKLTYDEAVREYELRRETKLGRLIANREMPVLKRAKEVLESRNEGVLQ